MNCLSNFDKCHAKCCKYFLVSTRRIDSDDFDRYLKLHRCKFIDDNHLLVYSPCSMLTKDGKCKLHGRNGKPVICREGYTENKKNVYWFKECIYNEKQEDWFENEVVKS